MMAADKATAPTAMGRIKLVSGELPGGFEGGGFDGGGFEGGGFTGEPVTFTHAFMIVG